MEKIVTIDMAVDAIKTAADEIPVNRLHILPSGSPSGES